jgi:hypothetical protein
MINFPECRWARLISQQICDIFSSREELNFCALFRPASSFECLTGRSHLRLRSRSTDLRYILMATEINVATLRVFDATEYSCLLFIHDFRIRSEA